MSSGLIIGLMLGAFILLAIVVVGIQFVGRNDEED
jgi:hypothetical protein